MVSTCKVRLVLVVNGKQKGTCYDEIGRCTQDITTTLGSVMNTNIGRTYVSINLRKKSSL